MTTFEELRRRGLLAQLTDEKEIEELVNAGKASGLHIILANTPTMSLVGAYLEFDFSNSFSALSTYSNNSFS